ncbi:polysaccharide deacetylase [Candidatus Stoquefichus massiliensis]|uniref:polysaccharide deacetylase n=1 Tax=Candidatus Stoquefichus massiliensis TaxID=1470350 RepID=UPI0004AD697D|nr:polysaccharide deacetylase [Candidatus Stoquefichus massiliensis]
MKKFFFSFIAVLTIAGLFYISQQPRIHFIHNEIHLSLYEEVKPYDYIEEVSHMDIEELEIQSHVNNEKLGEYKIEYIYRKRTFTLKIFIDDKIPPQFETINTKILRNEKVNPESLVKNIQDDSKTIVYFKEDYIFNEMKTYRVIVVVEDEYENKTEKNAYVLVEEKDSEAPTIQGIEKMTILIGDQIDLKKGVILKDDHDKNPKLTIDDSKLNIRKIGEYEVYYRVEDDSGNQETYTRIIEVLSQYDNREAKRDGQKVCYLTFDDGPSNNTAKILKILDEYHIKATFFVTGTSPQDFHYIKEAHQKGHTIGLHTYSHDYELIYSSLKNYINDLNKIKEVVYKQTGIETKFIRFPGGSSNLVSKKYNVGIMKRLTKKVIDLGYQYYDWTSINGDGEGIKTVDGLKKKAVEEIGDQEDIMFLMHDSSGQSNTVKSLPAILDHLIKKGYQFEAINQYSPTFHHTVQN